MQRWDADSRTGKKLRWATKISGVTGSGCWVVALTTSLHVFYLFASVAYFTLCGTILLVRRQPG
jgi:hypothetical protein